MDPEQLKRALVNLFTNAIAALDKSRTRKIENLKSSYLKKI